MKAPQWRHYLSLQIFWNIYEKTKHTNLSLKWATGQIREIWNNFRWEQKIFQDILQCAPCIKCCQFYVHSIPNIPRNLPHIFYAVNTNLKSSKSISSSSRPSLVPSTNISRKLCSLWQFLFPRLRFIRQIHLVAVMHYSGWHSVP